MNAATGTTVDARAYSGDLEDVLRDVLADALGTDGINGGTAAYNAKRALANEAKRLRREGMKDTACRIEKVVRAPGATTRPTAALGLINPPDLPPRRFNG